MSKNGIITNWDHTLSLIGHGNLYPDVEELMFKTLKLRQQLVKTYDRMLQSEYGITLYFNFSFNDDVVFKQKSKGRYGFEGLGISKIYQGALPFNLDFSMTSEQVKKLLQPSFVMDKYGIQDENALNHSFFYLKDLQLQVRVLYVKDIQDNAQKTIEEIFVEATKYIDLKRYGLKLDKI